MHNEIEMSLSLLFFFAKLGVAFIGLNLAAYFMVDMVIEFFHKRLS